MTEERKKWYVLRAVSGKENKVKEYLESEMKKTDLGKYVSQVLIPPTEKTYTIRNGKKVMKERAYLPGYVLIEAELTGDVVHELKNINYVAGFLPNTADPPSLCGIRRLNVSSAQWMSWRKLETRWMLSTMSVKM